MSEPQVGFMAFSESDPDIANEICHLPFRTDEREWFREYIRRQIEWSARTFGQGHNTVGLIKHITKELAEIDRAPNDLEEWIDVIILGLDGAWRCGKTFDYSPDQIMEMLLAKQQKNFSRTWIIKGEGEPIEHDRSQEEGS